MQVVNMGQYAHGNQPIQHMIYLYNYAGQPWKTSTGYARPCVVSTTPHQTDIVVTRTTARPQRGTSCRLSDSTPYVLAPTSTYLALRSTKKAKIHLANGKTVELSAPANSDENRYIESLSINGKAYGKNYVTHDQLLRGARLQYQMSSKPNMRRGTQPAAYPYSFSDNNE